MWRERKAVRNGGKGGEGKGKEREEGRGRRREEVCVMLC